MPSSPIMSARSAGEKLLQHRVDALGRAAAGVAQDAWLEHPDAALVEQSVEQPLARQRRVDQFVIFGRGGERLGFGPVVVFVDFVARGAGRRVAGIEIGLAAAFDRIGQELRHQAAGAPMRAGRRQAFADREAHERRDLFRALEILMRGFLQPLAVERDDALIARQARAGIDGEGEMALARAIRPSAPPRWRAPAFRRRNAPARAGSRARRNRRSAC